MSLTNDADKHWQTALDWVQRQHEGELDDAVHAELTAWLEASPVHQGAYDEACRVWLATGLVPPAYPHS